MPANPLYDTWFRQIRELCPTERVTRIRNLVWLMVGMHQSRSVHVSHIAVKLPLRATLLATVQRLTRFLQNPAFRVRPWYAPIAGPLLAEVQGPVRLIIDGSKVSAGHQLLMVALAYRKRALPIAWTWVCAARGHSGATKQLALLSYVHTLLPEQATVILVGDCEFGAVSVLQQLKKWNWQYVLRQKSNTIACVAKSFCRLDALVQGRNKRAWYPQALLTQEYLFRTSLLTYWETGQDEPWLLATNLPEALATWRAYRRRMWIEEMFGDWKGHGVDIEKTQLRHFQRLSRLTLAVALWYLWLVSRGAQAIKDGQRHRVDRKSRRDLSLFRIGLYMVDRCCALGQLRPIRLIPYFESVG
jgi:hypothetical protein